MLEFAKTLPLRRGTLVEDRETGRRGCLMDLVIERNPTDGRVIKKIAFIRPQGGGCEWETPITSIKLVD